MEMHVRQRSILKINSNEAIIVPIEGKTNNHNHNSKNNAGAYGLVVMTSPSHGGGRRFKSG